MYAVARHDASNHTLPLHEDLDDEDLKTFVKEYLQYKRGYGTDFENFFQNISKSPKWPVLNEQSVWFENGSDIRGHKTYRHEQRLELVELYFTAPTFETITLDAQVDFITKVSLIGGMLGLFTGFSFISYTEVLYYSLKLCNALIKRKAPDSRKN
jgi:hypothetical protein